MTTNRSRRRFFGTAAAAAAWTGFGRVAGADSAPPASGGGRLKLGLASYSMREFPLDQALAGSRFEEPQVLARAGLADADRRGSGGDASLSFDLDEEAHPGRVPELVQRAGGRHPSYR